MKKAERLYQLLITIFAYTLLFAGFARPLRAMTQDLGRHLLLGKLILQTGSVPKTNLFSYTYPTFPFINHHWLAEVFFYILFQTASFPGLFLFTLVAIGVAFGIVFFPAIKRFNPLAVGIVSFLSLGILFERTDIRPELISFILTSFFVTTLYTYRQRKTKHIFLLIPLMLLWVNIHIYFAIGILLMGLFFIDELVTHRKALLTSHTKILLLVTTLATLITLGNPNGIAGVLYPLHVFQNYGYTIEENQSIFLLTSLHFPLPTLPYLLSAIVLLFTCLLLTARKTSLIDWLLALTFSFLAIQAIRNLPLFALTTFLPFCASLSYIINHVRTRSPSFKFRTRLLPVLYVLLCALFVWQVITTAKAHPVGYSVADDAKPGADFFLSEHLVGPIFNNFDIGSYLIYRLYPKERVFVDGRPEAYPASFLQQVYIPMQQDPSLFAKVEQAYHFNTIFFSHTDQTPWGISFLKSIAQDPNWRIIYLDDTVVILVKNTENNQPLIQRFGMTQQTLHINHLDTHNTRSLLQLASFFSKVGWSDQEQQIYQSILAVDENNCLALYNFSLLLQAKNDQTASVYANRYTQNCQ